MLCFFWLKTSYHRFYHIRKGFFDHFRIKFYLSQKTFIPHNLAIFKNRLCMYFKKGLHAQNVKKITDVHSFELIHF